MDPDWPFDQAPNVAAITVQSILDGDPILLVVHDADDDGWQFLDGRPVRDEDGRVIAMRTALQLDPTVAEVADLPPGWSAWREGVGARWERAPNPTDPDEALDDADNAGDADEAGGADGPSDPDAGASPPMA